MSKQREGGRERMLEGKKEWRVRETLDDEVVKSLQCAAHELK
jgi:hypothetical protein